MGTLIYTGTGNVIHSGAGQAKAKDKPHQHPHSSIRQARPLRCGGRRCSCEPRTKAIRATPAPAPVFWQSRAGCGFPGRGASQSELVGVPLRTRCIQGRLVHTNALQQAERSRHHPMFCTYRLPIIRIIDPLLNALSIKLTSTTSCPCTSERAPPCISHSLTVHVTS